MLAGRGIIDHLRDVGRMVADAFEVLGDEQQMSGLADVVRIFHHVGEQGAEDGIVEIVDRGVALDDRGGLLRVARGEGVEHVVDHLRRDPRHLGEQRERADPALLDAGDALGDILGIIADPLDHARDLERGDDIAQIGLGGRAPAATGEGRRDDSEVYLEPPPEDDARFDTSDDESSARRRARASEDADRSDSLDIGGALELASKANRLKEELVRAPRKGEKSVAVSGVASLVLGPAGKGTASFPGTVR